DDPVPVADRLQRDRGTRLTARQKLLERSPLMGQALFADQPPVRLRHRGQGVMLVGIERDIFHLLRLLSRRTPLSVSPTHTVTVRARETQRFHAIKTSSHSVDNGRCSRDRRGYAKRLQITGTGTSRLGHIRTHCRKRRSSRKGGGAAGRKDVRT